MSAAQGVRKQWQRTLMMVGAGLFAAAVIMVTIGLIIGPGEQGNPEPEKRGTGSTSAPADEKAGGAGEGEDESRLVDAPKLDRDGLVPMEVTQDPRVAAASAAQVLMSVDTKQVKWVDDFREEALARVMRPTKDYVGPGSALQAKQFGSETLDGDDLIDRAPQMLATEKYAPDGWWWLLGDSQSFGGFTSYGAKLLSKAIEVYDQEEMSEYTGGSYWTSPSDSITVDLPAGASFELYWVRVETTTRTADGSTAARYPTAMAVYCDPPEVGGVCGVAALMTRYPDGWKTAY